MQQVQPPPGDPAQHYPDVIETGRIVAILPRFSSAWGVEETIREVDHYSDARVDWVAIDDIHIAVKAIGADLREVQRLIFSLGLNFDPNQFDLPGEEIHPDLVERNRFVPRSQG